MFGGIVIHGEKKGRQFGYPTANLDISVDKTRLKDGVYAVHVLLEKISYPAALVIQSEPKRVEVHLIGYDGDNFYGTYLEVDPIQKVSEIESFDRVTDLQKKIASDVLLVRDFLLTA
ncbi:MAG: hypothetical protein HN726_02380 [Candidatus Magasanikbacteria bacterium]|jgi:riboflavin kinase / FMN adenylyltransferase|nr:hypothetical protein [Candidatus Magasanikbacteria bacterium]MBT4221417.1 hypothetical protein [Candidatus Magasanikbacteria bacterium]MBT4350735.1 hypothetical protein [Candidatus Magasanikbacteria bacterium]MBT4541589.1 hypothetical protein [Candidatus Magasanikbacteria bacterium]MBT6253541.1 hypothetical protein [Candidatus Magasanikbacteria bacterium]